MSNANEGVNRIEHVGMELLKPYEKNPRKHGKAIDALVKSITENGFTNPIQIDQNNRIIAGHGRYQAAKRLGRVTVPCVRLDVTEQEYLKLLLSDNKIAELSKWENKMLQDVMSVMGDLREISIPGFEAAEIDKIFGHKFEEESTSPDAEADFGDAGKVKENSQDDRALTKSKKFNFTHKEYQFVDERLKAIKKEHSLETEVEALIEALRPYKGLQKVVTKKSEVKNLEVVK